MNYIIDGDIKVGAGSRDDVRDSITKSVLVTIEFAEELLDLLEAHHNIPVRIDDGITVMVKD